MSLAALELATPAALWAVAVGAPLVAAHLYFRRRRVRSVPFLGLLQESLGPIRSQARFKKLHDALALFCRLCALACLVLALAGLRPAEAKREPEDVAFVLDADITTSAREADGRSRFAHALTLVRAQLRALPANPEGLDDRVAIVRAGRVPTVLVPPTRDRDAALAALDDVPGPEPQRADLSAALRAALLALDDADKARLQVVTSRALSEVALPPGRRVVAVSAGRATDDQTISAVAIERRPDGLLFRLRIQLRNDHNQSRVRALVVRVGTKSVVEERVEVPAAGTADVTVKFDAPSVPEPLVVALQGEDAFPVGDRVHAWLPAAQRPSVLVVHGGEGPRTYTGAVMAALGAQIDQDASGTVAAKDFAKAAPRDVTIVDGVSLPAGALRPGAYVFLAPLGGDLPFTLTREVRDPLVWRSDRDHPLTRGLDFGAAYAARGWALAGEGLRPLAYVEGLPVVAEGERGGVSYVVLALDPHGSSLPLQNTYPLLLRNAILRLATAPRAPLRPLYRVGDRVRPDVALPGGPEVTMRWDGWGLDDVLGPTRGDVRARLAPSEDAWTVPATAIGAAQVRAGPPGAEAVVARTAFADFDPTRTIAIAHPPASLPPPVAVRVPQAARWRTGLIALAALFLLLDLCLLRPRRRAATA